MDTTTFIEVVSTKVTTYHKVTRLHGTRHVRKRVTTRESGKGQKAILLGRYARGDEREHTSTEPLDDPASHTQKGGNDLLVVQRPGKERGELSSVKRTE